MRRDGPNTHGDSSPNSNPHNVARFVPGIMPRESLGVVTNVCVRFRGVKIASVTRSL